MTEVARPEWEIFENYGHIVLDLINSSVNGDVFQDSVHDTVGSVAPAINILMSCAKSTVGIGYKHQIKVVNLPFFGAGLFCQHGVVSVLSTGNGESILQTVL